MKSFKYTARSRLCASLEVTSMERLLFLAEAVGPYVCMIKTHIDIISDFSLEGIEKLKALSRKYDFLIFEDRKFADIGKTVEAQCAVVFIRFQNGRILSMPMPFLERGWSMG